MTGRSTARAYGTVKSGAEEIARIIARHRETDLGLRGNATGLSLVLLLADDGSPTQTPRTDYLVSADLMQHAIARSSLAEGQFRSAMRGGGNSEIRCRTYIALLQTALAMPEGKGLTLLRAM